MTSEAANWSPGGSDECDGCDCADCIGCCEAVYHDPTDDWQGGDVDDYLPPAVSSQCSECQERHWQNNETPECALCPLGGMDPYDQAVGESGHDDMGTPPAPADDEIPF